MNKKPSYIIAVDTVGSTLHEFYKKVKFINQSKYA